MTQFSNSFFPEITHSWPNICLAFSPENHFPMRTFIFRRRLHTLKKRDFLEKLAAVLFSNSPLVSSTLFSFSIILRCQKTTKNVYKNILYFSVTLLVLFHCFSRTLTLGKLDTLIFIQSHSI